ncbi:hypothetical protein GIB67_038783 [Kingdonia uniflora]|uniref:Uncharacterized protein n=1 Tax=Kingdonia uniflora TaxID=39325 RepID=A0A7J7M0X1_9MAGN|nr:hypothetical protein GIB67_038783 [Kingdonia uniflora]
MKNLYQKNNNKGKVFPTPSSSSSSSSNSGSDVLSVLKLLPVAILALSTVLSEEDKEVLAYLITRSMKMGFSVIESQKKPHLVKPHKTPLFDCGCFDCYISYWFRWDSSPNRELIHQAIEAYEDHLTNGENSKKKGGKKRREKVKSADTEQLQLVPVPIFPLLQSQSDALSDVASSETSDDIEEVVVNLTHVAEPETSLSSSESSSSSSSSDKELFRRQIELLHEYGKMMIEMREAKEKEQEATSSRTRGGSQRGRIDKRKSREHKLGKDNLNRDYFSDNPRFKGISFRRRFRMSEGGMADVMNL